MEGYKHFSHDHHLNHHQVPQGTEITCSGCKLTATGTVFVCLPCNFYLHENCYHATRSFKHPSHPSHPLTLVPYPTYPSNSFYCNTCTLIGTGFSYSCCNCEFDLHIHCAYNNSSHQNLPPPTQTPSFIHHQPKPNHILTPNAAPHAYMPHQAVTHHPIPHNHEIPSFSGPTGVHTTRAPTNFESSKSSHGEIMHFSHKHALRPMNLKAEDYTNCSGCEKGISGPGYECTESSCYFHLDNFCFHLAPEINHKSHPGHPLTLLSTAPYQSNHFICSACSNDGGGFTYHCATCEFDLHISCFALTETVKREDHQHPLRLMYSTPSQAKDYRFECDVCHSDVPNLCWIYYCKQCDFGTHTHCVNSKVLDAADLAEQLVAAQIKARLAAKGRQYALQLLDPPETTYKYKYYDNI